MSDKIRWTTSEWRQLALWFIGTGLDPNRHGFRTNLDRAQKECLEACRHRPLVSLSAAGAKRDLLFAMGLAKQELSAEKLAAPELVATPEDTRTDALSAAFEELIRRVVREELARAGAEGRRGAGTTPDATEVSPTPPTVRHNPLPQGEKRAEQLRIYVMGPLNGQQRELESRLLDFDLRFHQVGNDVVKSAQGCSHIVLWTKFCGHYQQNAAKKCAAQLVYANGGIENLEKTIRGLV